MPLNDIGPKGFVEGRGVATLSYTPLFDRAGIITDIIFGSVSARDVWIVSIQGRELARYDIGPGGYQQLLTYFTNDFPSSNNLFDFVKARMPLSLTYPVPLGQTFTISSVGGATANISLSFVEVTPAEITPNMINHPAGRRFIVPLIGYRSAPVTAVGENEFDTQIGPDWFPNIFTDGILPPDWNISVVDMFLDAGGVNTYDGAADHQSITTYLAIISNGQRMYTRYALGGIPLLGSPSFDGHANSTVYTDLTPFPAFQLTNEQTHESMGQPLMFGSGGSYQLRLNIDGDVTGGADYSGMRQVFLCDVRIGGGF